MLQAAIKEIRLHSRPAGPHTQRAATEFSALCRSDNWPCRESNNAEVHAKRTSFHTVVCVESCQKVLDNGFSL
jgi:hypothetical protein